MRTESKEVKLKGVSRYAGFSISATRVVTLNMIMGYEEIVTSVQLLQGLNTDISVLAKLGIKKPKGLGMFTVNAVNFDKDGNAKVSLKSMVDNVELDNIMKLIECNDVIQMMFKAIIELPGEVIEEDEVEDVIDDEDEEEDELPFN